MKKYRKDGLYMVLGDMPYAKFLTDYSIEYGDKVINKGKIVAINGIDNVFIYCNEMDKKRGKFLFKCCKGCKHNPF